MPSANCARVRFSIFAASCGCIMPEVRLVTKLSRSIPSIKSIGSSTLPFDLDILSPLSSRIRPVIYMSLKGILPVNFLVIIIMRATQKKMMSNPVTNTELGTKVSSSGVCFGQPMVANGHSADENHVSRTSLSWRKATDSAKLCFSRTSCSVRPT